MTFPRERKNMTAQIIRLEDVVQERERKKQNILCFSRLSHLIARVSKTIDREEVLAIFTESLTRLDLGPKPFTKFKEAIARDAQLEMMGKHLQCLLAEYDMAEPFRIARKLYPEDLDLIHLIKRNFEVFSLDVSRAFLVKRDEVCVQGATKKQPRVESPTPFLYPKRTILRRVFFSLWGKVKDLPALFINFQPTKRSKTMKHVSKNKRTTLKENFSRYKKLYGVAALTLIAGAVFSENVHAAADVPADFEGGYEIGVNWFKKGSRLAIAGAVSIGLVTAITAGNILRAGLFAVLGFGGISFLKFIWTQLETMFG